MKSGLWYLQSLPHTFCLICLSQLWTAFWANPEFSHHFQTRKSSSLRSCTDFSDYLSSSSCAHGLHLGDVKVRGGVRYFTFLVLASWGMGREACTFHFQEPGSLDVWRKLMAQMLDENQTTVWESPIKLSTHPTRWPKNPTPRNVSTRNENMFIKTTYLRLFITVLFVITKNINNLNIY